MKSENNRSEEILNSINNIGRAAAPDFFYTRLKARMEKENEISVRRPWFLRPAYTFAALVIVLVINAVVLFKGNMLKATEGISENDTMLSIAAEYNLNDNSVYDLNQDR
jgi:Na+/proline symporter